MKNIDTLESIKNALENMSTSELVYIHNEYCVENQYSDDEIFSMEEFDYLMSGNKPWEVARAAYYGDFCPAHDYFWFNGYGNLESSDFPKSEIDIDAIAEWLCESENWEDYNITIE